MERLLTRRGRDLGEDQAISIRTGRAPANRTTSTRLTPGWLPFRDDTLLSAGPAIPGSYVPIADREPPAIAGWTHTESTSVRYRAASFGGMQITADGRAALIRDEWIDLTTGQRVGQIEHPTEFDDRLVKTTKGPFFTPSGTAYLVLSTDPEEEEEPSWQVWRVEPNMERIGFPFRAPHTGDFVTMVVAPDLRSVAWLDDSRNLPFYVIDITDSRPEANRFTSLANGDQSSGERLDGPPVWLEGIGWCLLRDARVRSLVIAAAGDWSIDVGFPEGIAALHADACGRYMVVEGRSEDEETILCCRIVAATREIDLRWERGDAEGAIRAVAPDGGVWADRHACLLTRRTVEHGLQPIGRGPTMPIVQMQWYDENTIHWLARSVERNAVVETGTYAAEEWTREPRGSERATLIGGRYRLLHGEEAVIVTDAITGEIAFEAPREERSSVVGMVTTPDITPDGQSVAWLDTITMRRRFVMARGSEVTRWDEPGTGIKFHETTAGLRLIMPRDDRSVLVDPSHDDLQHAPAERDWPAIYVQTMQPLDGNRIGWLRTSDITDPTARMNTVAEILDAATLETLAAFPLACVPDHLVVGSHILFTPDGTELLIFRGEDYHRVRIDEPPPRLDEPGPTRSASVNQITAVSLHPTTRRLALATGLGQLHLYDRDEDLAKGDPS